MNKYKDVKDKKVPEKNRMTTEQIIQKIENNKIPGIRYWLRNSTDNEKNDIKLSLSTSYYNAGVLLLNLKYWRENKLFEKFKKGTFS